MQMAKAGGKTGFLGGLAPEAGRQVRVTAAEGRVVSAGGTEGGISGPARGLEAGLSSQTGWRKGGA